ncbi:hypothetical protein BTR14_06475 [Rhizobium rhizosphaerae]|uniref:Uncharacterized protein n=1 Tax=Xaviernesmea rhizosphaerae TaxID=1672749 RepID=A0ABX3PG18_9HYPH|nr:hypothetical protein [Xaviernesmea rhizosphaerae]OQP87081.1 hypothetical protein BTR14_06475 [Xaviernesmea rhizosphaerae]
MGDIGKIGVIGGQGKGLVRLCERAASAADASLADILADGASLVGVHVVQDALHEVPLTRHSADRDFAVRQRSAGGGAREIRQHAEQRQDLLFGRGVVQGCQRLARDPSSCQKS